MRLIGLEKTTQRIPFHRNVDVKALIPLEMTYYKFMFSLFSLLFQPWREETQWPPLPGAREGGTGRGRGTEEAQKV